MFNWIGRLLCKADKHHWVSPEPFEAWHMIDTSHRFNHWVHCSRCDQAAINIGWGIYMHSGSVKFYDVSAGMKKIHDDRAREHKEFEDNIMRVRKEHMRVSQEHHDNLTVE